MWSASKVRTVLWQSATSVSTKLSIAVVVGFALIPLIPRPTPSTARAAPTQQSAEPKVEIARVKPDPLVQPRIGTEPATVASIGDLSGGAEADNSLVQLAAAKRRARQGRQEQSKQEEAVEARRTPSAIATEEPERKPSAVATEQPSKAPIPSPDSKTETAEAEPPKPDVWSDAEVIAALKECVRMLGPIAAEIEVATPVKQDQCGTPAPLMLRRIGSGANKVEINPPAMLNCAMVVGLHTWVEKTLQPAAMETFGSPIARLRNASGYSCRNRNGSIHNADKLSEHAHANAVDIGGFVTADGRSIEVARYWGPTARDIREAERLAAAARAKEAKETREAKAELAKAEPARFEPKRSSSAIATRPDGTKGRDQRSAEVQPSGLQTQGRSMVDAKAIPLPSSTTADLRNSTEAAFLRRLHNGACGTFGTVLGPEANEAHRDHFHFDLAVRRRNAFCQ